MMTKFGIAAVSAATNDIFPGDYYPSNPGDKIVSLYAFDRVNLGPYAGKVVSLKIDKRARSG